MCPKRTKASSKIIMIDTTASIPNLDIIIGT